MWVNSWWLTNTACITCSQSNETLLSPSTTPWVLNLPRSIHNTHQQHSVVQVCSTVAEHTRCVMWPSSSVHTNSNWSPTQTCLNSTASTYLTDRSNVEFASLFLASLGHTLVWISSLSSDSVILDVSQSKLSWSSVATMGSIWSWAIDKLLFRKINSFFLKESPWFAWSNCSKCPTRTACALIFDSWDSTFGSPVDFHG